MKRHCNIRAFEVFLLSQVKFLQCGIYCDRLSLSEANQVERNTCFPLSLSKSDSRHNSELLVFFMKALSEAASNVKCNSKSCPFFHD